jgi:hypothetical protein
MQKLIDETLRHFSQDKDHIYVRGLDYKDTIEFSSPDGRQQKWEFDTLLYGKRTGHFQSRENTHFLYGIISPFVALQLLYQRRGFYLTNQSDPERGFSLHIMITRSQPSPDTKPLWHGQNIAPSHNNVITLAHFYLASLHDAVQFVTDVFQTRKARSAEVIPAEATLAEVTPAEAKSAEATPAEAKSAEATPAEAKSAEATPAEANSAEATLAEAKSAEAKSAEVIQAELKIAELEITEAELEAVEAELEIAEAELEAVEAELEIAEAELEADEADEVADEAEFFDRQDIIQEILGCFPPSEHSNFLEMFDRMNMQELISFHQNLPSA